MPTIPDISSPEWDRKSKNTRHPKVSIIVPARNEEASIAASLSQLLNLEYDSYEVIAVNDRSDDGTGEIMEHVASGSGAHARLKVVHIDELPHGWLGKAHAMWTAGKAASGEWLLFTDADVLFRPDSLRRAIAYAEAERADHLVVFPWMIMKTAGEKMMIAFFQTLFIFGHRPWKVADPKTKDHMGVGAFNMVRREVYEAIGSYHALRFEVIDDMTLGTRRETFLAKT
jgi:cellulose synthase/poly-beta-1,6-N-acetylglucosamine synthase-like glycosyltransferase